MVARLLANSESQSQLAHKHNQYMEDRFHKLETELRNQKASIQTIENQAITLRSGKSTTAPPLPASPSSSLPPVIEEVANEILAEVHSRPGPANTAQAKEPVKDYTPPVPYPSRLKKQKLEEHYGKFLELFKQLHINLPFVEALAQMPKYAKFLKDILTNKKKLEELSHVTLSEECSAILQNKLPQKMNDLGSFTIPCLIGSFSVSNALADLGASINLMAYAVFEKLGVEEHKPTRMSIQLADRSVKYPRGIVENLLVKINRFVFPVDFVILDIDEDNNVPLILGRPFLATARALIDVCSGKLTLRVYDEEVTFDIGRSMRHPQSQDDSLYFIDVVDSCMSDPSQDGCVVEEMVALLSHDPSPQDEAFEVMDCKAEPKALPSVEDPPSVELTELPGHLEHAFLDGESRLPVIISAALSSEEKAKFLEVLKMHKKAIAWKIMHQRRLNPNMQVVVKKEIIKLLDADLIYPISDSAWVSPVQVVPKKGGMTVTTNEKNELIPTRTITRWRVCIDYCKLNDATRKDHFPLPFIDKMLERLSGKTFYCFLDGFSGYFQIPIAPEDQEKTTFTCLYGTIAYRRMPFGLCNAPATFQRCMVAIFHDMIKDSMGVFMDDFSIFGSSFDHCLENLRKMLARCEEANLVLNWEKCHFMVKEGIVLGHNISCDGLDVDRANIETIVKLPPSTSVKYIRSYRTPPQGLLNSGTQFELRTQPQNFATRFTGLFIGYWLVPFYSEIWDPVPEEHEEEEEEREEERVHEEEGQHQPPSNLDLWYRFAGLQASQKELRAEQGRFNQRIDNFRAEQTRQYMHDIRVAKSRVVSTRRPSTTMQASQCRAKARQCRAIGM
ncbi:hypothetical protein E3N88_12171 [Mikania micrantha]|uniref:Reverse transcriptase domain-containing protein n=1 Tax=Mikania micrantha TaxID=192012 RepID=A0A5N6P525_9ASTR|nr:hypothetical protein E3N88_12171 [Mikania micrantha]